MHRPSGLYLERGASPRFYVGEIGGGMAVNQDIPNIGPRVSIYSGKGELLARLGNRPAGLEPGQFISPHGLAVDSRGEMNRSEEHTSELQSRLHLVCRLLLEKKKRKSRPQARQRTS